MDVDGEVEVAVTADFGFSLSHGDVDWLPRTGGSERD